MDFPTYKKSLVDALEVDDETIDMLIETFFESTTSDMQELSKLVETLDFANIALKAHAIKGASSSMRFDELAKLLKIVELATKESNGELCIRTMSEIKAEFDSVALMCSYVQ